MPGWRMSRFAVRWYSRRAEWLGVGAVLAFSLLVRLRAARIFNGNHPNSPARLTYADEPSYYQTALDLLQGAGFPSPERLPLYPSWIALVHGVSGGNFDVVPYAQAVIGTATVFLTYLLGRMMLGHRTGLIAAALASVSFVLIRQSNHVMAEVMFTPALLLVCILLLRAIRRPGTARFAWAGVSVGVANLIRPTLLFFPIFVAVLLLIGWRNRSAVRFGAVYVLTALLVTAPWTLHNYLRHGVLLPLATSNATLWLGSPEYYHLVRDQGFTYYRIWDEIIYPDDGSAPFPATIEGEAYWNERALTSIRREPLTYLKYAAEKLITFWTGDPNADWADTHIFNYRALRGWGFSRSDALQLMAARALAFLALAAAFVLRSQWPKLVPAVLLIGYCNLLHAATVARARMSEPLQPLLLILVSAALLHVFASLKRRHAAAREHDKQPFSERLSAPRVAWP